MLSPLLPPVGRSPLRLGWVELGGLHRGEWPAGGNSRPGHWAGATVLESLAFRQEWD